MTFSKSINRLQTDQRYVKDNFKETRAVRGSDYSSATALSEEKDKLITENWNDRENKYPRIIPKPHAHLHSMQKTSANFQNN